jgi:holo-[acyl-carrier protein] synthase
MLVALSRTIRDRDVAAPMSVMSTAKSAKFRVGIDLVRISRIEDSLQRFGERFLKRVFHPDEISYAKAAPFLSAQRLAARFAAKEAALKALRLAHRGVSWRDIEVRRAYDGDCALILHGGALLAAHEAGIEFESVSLTHEGDYASAVVLARAGFPATPLDP